MGAAPVTAHGTAGRGSAGRGAAPGDGGLRGGAAAPLAVRELGRVEYRVAWALQKELVAERLAGRAPDSLLLLEHEPVVTLGRGTKRAFLAAGGRTVADGAREFLALPGGARTELIEVERGGEATWHGPGQLVAYPIVALAPGRRDLHAWMRALEQAVIDTLAGLGLPGAGRVPGATGVWIDGSRKIASIGVAASRWVTYHGLALNVDPDLARFEAIRPCGFEAGVMTSVARESRARGTGCFPALPDVAAALAPRLEAALLPFRSPAPEEAP